MAAQNQSRKRFSLVLIKPSPYAYDGLVDGELDSLDLFTIGAKAEPGSAFKVLDRTEEHVTVR